MQRRDLYDSDAYKDILDRLGELNAESQPQWGSMTVAQMLAHCAEVQDVTNGKELKGTPFIVKLMGGVIRKTVLAEKPYPKNLRTHKQYLMSDPEDFSRQMDRLLDSIKTMQVLGRRETKHPLFGKMSASDNGWAMYKHLDHHLTQFGV